MNYVSPLEIEEADLRDVAYVAGRAVHEAVRLTPLLAPARAMRGNVVRDGSGLGGDSAVLLFGFGELDVALSIELAQPGLDVWRVRGLLMDHASSVTQWAGCQARVVQNEVVVGQDEIDDLGNFHLDEVPGGVYDVWLENEDYAVVLRSVRMGARE